MTSTTVTKVDPKDIAAVEALASLVKQFMEVGTAIQPVLKRLDDSDYAGAGRLMDDLFTALQDDLRNLSSSLEEFDAGGGDQAAYDYYEYCVKGKLTVAQAASKILDEDHDDAHLARIEPLRRYAASLEPGK